MENKVVAVLLILGIVTSFSIGLVSSPFLGRDLSLPSAPSSERQIRMFELPEAVQLRQNVTIDDFYHRSTLNPENAIPYYTTATTGNSSASIFIGPGRTSLSLKTGAVAGDSVDVRMSELLVERNKTGLNEFRTKVNTAVLFSPTMGNDVKGFVGLLLASNTALTSLPGKAGHMGISWDTSVSPNFFFTWSNGITQETSDTHIPIEATFDYQINIFWYDENKATLKLLARTGTSVANQEVTDLRNMDTGMLHYYLQTNADVVREMRVIHVRFSAT